MESGLECACVNNDNFTVLVNGGCRVSRCTMWPLHSKWLSEYSKRISIKFCVKLEHSSMETIQMIQKAPAMGSQWVAAAPQQRAHLHITSSVDFWQNAKSPRWLSPLTAQIWWHALLDFPQTKITFEREEISDWMRFRKIQQGNWWRLGELCEVPRCLLGRGLRCH